MDRSTAIAMGVGGATVLFLAGVLLWPHPAAPQPSGQPVTGPAVVFLSQDRSHPGVGTLAVRTVPGNGTQTIAQVPTGSTVQLSPNGSRVAVFGPPAAGPIASSNQAISAYSLTDNRLLWRSSGFQVAFAPRSGLAAVSRWVGGRIHVLVLSGKGKTVADLSGPSQNASAAMEPPVLFTPDGSGLVYPDSLGNLVLYHPGNRTSHVLYAPTGHPPVARQRLYAGTPLFVSPHRLLFALVAFPAADQLGLADLYLLDTRSGRRIPFGHSVWNGGTWQKAGSRILLSSFVHGSACYDPGVLNLSSPNGRTWKTLPLDRSLPAGLTAAQRAQVNDMSPFYRANLSPNGTQALVQADIRFCPVWSSQAVPTARQLWRMPLTQSGMGTPRLVASGTLPTGNPWSPGGHRFLVLSQNGSLTVQDAATGKRSLLAQGVTWAAWSPYVPPLPASAFPSLSGSSLGPL